MSRLLRHATRFAIVLGLLSSSSAEARDWFVRAGAAGGDGSMVKPFADPWQALDKCEAGDAIHVTAGKYFGRSDLGTWKIPYDGVQLLGGYDASFKERDPWKNHTELLWDKTSKNWPKEERVSSNASNVVVDGVTIDMKDQIQYADAAMSGRTEKASEDAMRFTAPVTVRNSIIINPGANGIDCVPGSTIENNLIVNALGWGVALKGQGETAKNAATIRGNTILFTADFKKPGTGGYGGAAVALQGPALVTKNILANSDNNAIYQTFKPERVSITQNVFFMNLYSNVKFGIDGRDTVIDDKSMDLLEEAGFKAFDGNEVKNPLLDVDPAWMDRYSKRTASQPGKVDMNDWNKARQALGLPILGKGYVSAGGVAPPWDLEKAIKLMQPKAAITAGARRQKLEVNFAAPAAAAAAKTYARVELTSWNKNPSSVEGKPVEMIVAIGLVANVGGIPAQYPEKDHEAIALYDKDGKGERVTGFYKKGSSAQRACDAATGYYTGNGVPDRLYVVRGIAYEVRNLPKAGLFVESVEPYEAGATTTAKKTTGRDWYVSAGATGGDGSLAKPFKDPYQALEKCESGDTINVSEGDYVGKLHAGMWTIDTTHVTLLGGYDRDFKTRNPWKHPTLLHTADDFKGTRGGYTIQGDKDHTGAVIDGFVFDKRGNNKYTPTGDLDYSRSDKTEHIWLARAECVIRNNVFLNGAEGALRVANGQTVENNIFINHWTKTVDVQPGFGNDPFVFRHNTVAFAWDLRFGKGLGSNGNLLILGTRTRAIVDANIFEFADNDAIRLNADAKDVELTNNTFSHNLWSHVQKPDGWVTVDDKSWSKLADFGWKKLAGNTLVSAALPVNAKWFELYLGRTAFTPGKVTMDDWNQLRGILGQPVIATGGKGGSGMAPAYDWKDAIAFFPKNAKVTAGARASELGAHVATQTSAAPEPSFEYQDVTWDAAKSADAWDKLQGKRVALTVVIRDTDNQYQLADIKKEDYLCFTVAGPLGMDSGGLPLRVYVKKGSKHERTVQNAKSYSSGTPDQTYVLKGVVRSPRQMIAESVTRAD